MRSPFFDLVSDFATEIAFISFFTIGVNGRFLVEKVTSPQISLKIVWTVYTLSSHSIGNVTHFKEITSLKQTNLQVVSQTSSF